MSTATNKVYDCLVMPSAGIGTGLARLGEKAPLTFECLCNALKRFFKFDNQKGSFINLDEKYPVCNYDLPVPQGVIPKDKQPVRVFP